ncbi:Phosphopantothenoylcysteine decarboxylase [Fructilactobacillus florum 8D]|uniref:Coenzyme A biosynthesis bifunctional protein CoaBC n=1 Tax=Fructilactobacillus florum 8D TaxID=1221538 RepID=W9EDN2_9LACO|nr:bifunctional phosphopantothenoylcysteine decarboxylase/phosphopantothenate--cysteine ligase CoaBC [Fructilactobacillus florum]ETO40192.1 Phosphopantothenoylcysteine decarboxylase [Fructilactobacillus florum 8D]
MHGKKIVLYVTGSVASYKAISLLRRLQAAGATVRVVLTPFAERFVTKELFQAVAPAAVYDDDDYFRATSGIEHVELAQWADLAVVVPASADFIAKAAHGIADNFALTTWLATTGLKLMVPAMNDVMWQNAATQANVATLKNQQVDMVGPVTGMLAEGYAAPGRMSDQKAIMTVIAAKLVETKQLTDWKKLNLVVTAGATREPLDPIRFISNRSSGKMGFAVAAAARERGAQVTLIAANTQLAAPAGVKVVPVTTTEQLATAVQQHFATANLLVMAAAVSDFKPLQPATKKIKRRQHDQLAVTLVHTPDILEQVARKKRPDQLVCGFAAETDDVIAAGRRELQQKHLDLIAINDVSNPEIGFDSDKNQVTILTAAGLEVTTPIESKLQVAQKLLEVAVKLFDD